ncbi:MAG: helix-turn-helix domain-containing protein [Deltaproteobacteria bacterium]|nr:helix-turn-helix domain-containing protein [Deltaproteobacteria bacterium]
MSKEKRLLTVQATEKTLELLEILAGGNERLTIGALADKLCMRRNDALLLLVTLESRGMVRWDDAGKIYRLGGKSAELARQMLCLPASGGIEPKLPATPLTLNARAAGTRKLRLDRRFEMGGLSAAAT